ncbi:hypothetical protein [Streptococcus pluranimalium]|uniref:Uncharacterized protein n=1 Tax=Streptococcus pluranimalium TaxID=82348 RepID=A0A345VJG8_9STRE|nr:hypothetical protein [Streptococcus pluranimalium]AXJ12870.1 hypothetical protein Sp14A_09490 [Streptococcus pluranimalium]
MAITDKDFNEISNRVYNVDRKKQGVLHIRAGQEIMEGKYKVLKVEDNPDNGMQAMAVVPVDKNGKADYSEVVIAYAGTN